ncbi:uncharacterized protein LAESUDRAFT_760550 [Laetiporus sulphureus 93-53]|uniref:Protein-S-isoprenylcysteine O-methyltransferase n=1 Tax=Laetiporus sulphureus 93-53 TaxID=1314785 RepID=A0A165DKS9_9APHY|nr:uncharacterized protein LAESUDRAFT_760550 [Laetiporus sulphureus 93-53]KZT05102.1 hypothetical protein LAESUDRAFT_760550 [Laetiporus sulphureus 93-53]
MALALLKIPMLFVAAAAIHVSSAAPNPSPSRQERNRFRTVAASSTAFRASAAIPALIQFTIWMLTICESTVIIASHYPGVFSRRILTLLTFGARASPSAITLTSPFLIGFMLETAGSAIRIGCFWHLGQLFSFQTAIRKEHALITDGPYTVVRHPAYAGSLLRTAGILLCQLGRGSWLSESRARYTPQGCICVLAGVVYMAALLATVAVHSGLEDRELKEKFGKEWEEWAEKTSSKLFLGLY